ncbi:unnamed protein product [Sphagnum balticum]
MAMVKREKAKEACKANKLAKQMAMAKLGFAKKLPKTLKGEKEYLCHKKKVKGITLLDGLLKWKQSRIYVSKGKLSMKVMQEVPMVGHHGEKTTRELLEKTFYWSEMKEDV